MGHQHVLRETNRVFSSRRRWLRIVDLMVVVALAALRFRRSHSPQLTSDEKWLMGTLGFAFLGVLFAQWGIAGISVQPFPLRNPRRCLAFCRA